MNVRRALIPLLCAMCMLASGCSDDNISIDTGAPSTVASETQQSVLPPETTQAASVLSMIPLPPDREYVEAFDPDNRTIELYNPCDDFTAEELAEIGLEKIMDTAVIGNSVIDCGMKVINQRGSYNITTHWRTFDKFKSLGWMIDATFPDADKQVYFHVIDSSHLHCSTTISTTHGSLSVVSNVALAETVERDELCRRAYDVLQKIRVKGGYK